MPIIVSAQDNIDSLVNRLSAKQLAGQIIMVYHSPPEFLEKNQLGNVLVMQNMLRDPNGLKRQLKRINKWEIPAFVAIDQEGGKVNRMKRLKNAPIAPSAQEMVDLDSNEVFRSSFKMATLMHEYGINLNLAPVLDPVKNEMGEYTFMRLNQRSFGIDSMDLKNVSPFIKAMSKAQVGCITKHFPGYDSKTNSDHEPAHSQVDSVGLNRYLESFYTFDSLTLGTMMSSIHYEKISHTSAVFDSNLVKLARANDSNRMVITDDLWGVALRPMVLKGYLHPKSDFTDKDFLKIVDAALDAGNDLLMITFPAKAVIMQEYIIRRMKKETDFAERIKKSVRRILLAKQKLGLIP